MLKTLLFMMFYISSIMPFISTPVSLGFLILIQTFILCLISRVISISSWVPMSIFLIMVGGLMVIFMYTTSICSNVQFKISNMKLPLMYSILSLPMFYTTPTQLLMYDNFQLMDNMNFDFLKLFMPLNIFMSTFMFIYLLAALIIMINMMTLTKGPMRKKY
uniref:NADH dehydrogenase subunit 6 n=1 Tax=Diaphorina lycii TaxID=2047824 RepID=A0A343M3B4_9HEMI|nr:NADH dehydrogenase subunit 6 [Diaphorina lycii]ATR80193.1 NADH dehydrogenase subunit 6 [Diaphorina lycii]